MKVETPEGDSLTERRAGKGLTEEAEFHVFKDEKRESQNLEWFGVEKTLKTISLQPLAMCRRTLHYPRVLRAPTSLAWDTSRRRSAAVWHSRGGINK